MITFVDGPAAGVKLSLARLPHFLRVTFDGKKYDALDQPDDKPTANERLYVYAFNSHEGAAFIDGRDPKTGKRFGRVEHVASYRFHSIQPPDSEIRSAQSWSDWCYSQPEAAKFQREAAAK